MQTNSLGHDDGHLVQLLRLPQSFAQPSLASEFVDVPGLINITVRASDAQPYDVASEALTRGAPVRALPAPPRRHPQPSRFRPKDLIAELDTINAQIHKMMFQVERAVARLATSY